ncbi:unnamed protein product [Adineta ricciae]|uniref:Nuclear receptor domain-containing protein n=1 Tax=Adineta ricciae TaxID=249248 RepID=A0A815MKH8_ADIRI|nr:unnamed protein product [Adineta ricciae]
MSSKRHLSASLPSLCTDDSKTRMHEGNMIKSNICQICGDKANIFNYGALACQSSCRLTKCFTMGMDTYLIRKEIQSRKTNVSRIQSKSNQVSICDQERSIVRLFGSDSSRNNRSLLDNVEWTLLSNIVHAYDTYTDVSPINCYVKQLFISSSSTSDMALKLANVREITTFVYKSIQSFISASPDFRTLTAGEQTSLFERNLPCVAAFYLTVLFRVTGMTRSSQCIDAFALVYGSDMMEQTLRIDQRLDADLTIVKLTLMILAFSSNCFLVHKIENFQNNSFLHGTYCLLGSQTAYVELLWKYMTYRYGYDDSIRRFSRLIEVVLDLIKYSSHIYANNSKHQDLVEGVLEQMKRSILIEHNKQEPLWGKT